MNSFLPTTRTLLYFKNGSNDMNNPSQFVFNHCEIIVITRLNSCSFLFQWFKTEITNSFPPKENTKDRGGRIQKKFKHTVYNCRTGSIMFIINKLLLSYCTYKTEGSNNQQISADCSRNQLKKRSSRLEVILCSDRIRNMLIKKISKGKHQ